MVAPNQLTDVRIGDDADAWAAAGFHVAGSALTIDRTQISLAGSQGERGILSIAIEGVIDDIDVVAGPHLGSTGISVHHRDPVEPSHTPHPNHITGVDHLVVMSPDCDRTTTALQAAGLEARRVREFTIGGVARRQTFFWMGRVILELVGPHQAEGDGPPELWGLALTTTDIDATAAALGTNCTPPKDAVQPGRKIATLKTRDLGISTAIAIMTPHPGAAGGSRRAR